MAWNNLLNFLWGGTRSAEVRETLDRHRRVTHLIEDSPFTDDKRRDFVIDLVIEACRRGDLVPVGALTEALGQLVDDLLSYDGLLFGIPTLKNADALTADEGMALRARLARKERFLLDHERQLDLWREKVVRIIEGLLGYLPPTAFKGGWSEEEPDADAPGAMVPLVDLLENPAEVLDRLIITFHDDDITQADLFSPLREQLLRRIFVASDIRWEDRFNTKRNLVYPSTSKHPRGVPLAELFLQGTPWLALLCTPLPFTIPFPARFEHTHIVGGSGHGKTQLLQLHIVRDLIESTRDGRSVIVMDSQGDLIRTLSRLDLLAPGAPGGLAERVVQIDPTDVEFPVALNMFDADRSGLATMTLLERERVLNATVDLYEYFFGALLGAELTARQGIIFKYLARLLLEIPDATIHTLRQLMENAEPFRPYIQKLPPTARAFFENRFFDRSFNETKKQVLTRLWGVLSNATFDRMFSHPRSKIDMFGALQEGRIVFINTAKDLLKEDGASILGRFFIALIAQAAMRRASIPTYDRRPCFFYIDEAADYIDDRIGGLLNQARKYKVGMTLAHQNLDQLPMALRASFFSSTSIKMVGGVSNKDATVFASEMKTDAAFIQSQRKRRAETSFACHVRNVTPGALSVSIPLGAVEALAVMTPEQEEEVRARNRDLYCVPLSEVPEPAPPPSPPAGKPATRSTSPKSAPAPSAPAQSNDPDPAYVNPREAIANVPDVTAPPTLPGQELAPQAAELPPPSSDGPPASDGPARRARTKRRPSDPPPEAPPLGRGGKEHRYLQNLLREFGQSKGFKATVEETILDGAGRVDVSLAREGLRVACEISVTTGRDYELGNLEKCLAADYARILFVSSDIRHLNAMQKLATGRFEEDELAKLEFASPEEALTSIAALAGTAVSEATVRGYRVKTRQASVDSGEVAKRREAVAAVIARSLRNTRGANDPA